MYVCIRTCRLKMGSQYDARSCVASYWHFMNTLHMRRECNVMQHKDGLDFYLYNMTQCKTLCHIVIPALGKCTKHTQRDK